MLCLFRSLVQLAPVFAFLCLIGHVRADDAVPDARSLFEQGVTASQDGVWESAAMHFEASLALSDRPATRVNLVHVYGELARPLEVTRHAIAFLALPPEPHRADARREVEAALLAATAKLATLGLDSLPAHSVPLVDGAAPAVRDERRVYVLPGLHRLELQLPGGGLEVIELTLGAGQTLIWPRQGQAVQVLAAPQPPKQDEPTAPPPKTQVRAADLGPLEPPPPPRWRKRLAIATGTLAATTGLTAVGMYMLTVQREDDVRHADPYRPGFFATVDGFARASNSVTPLSLGAGVLAASAVALGPRSSRWGTRASGIVALGLGGALLATGILVAARTPRSIGNTRVDEPTRPLGAMVAALSAPFVSYGLSVLITFDPHAKQRDLALTRLP